MSISKTFTVPAEKVPTDGSPKVSPEAIAIFEQLMSEGKILDYSSITNEDGSCTDTITYLDQNAADEHSALLEGIDIF